MVKFTFYKKPRLDGTIGMNFLYFGCGLALNSMRCDLSAIYNDTYCYVSEKTGKICPNQTFPQIFGEIGFPGRDYFALLLATRNNTFVVDHNQCGFGGMLFTTNTTSGFLAGEERYFCVIEPTTGVRVAQFIGSHGPHDQFVIQFEVQDHSSIAGTPQSPALPSHCKSIC